MCHPTWLFSVAQNPNHPSHCWQVNSFSSEVALETEFPNVPALAALESPRTERVMRIFRSHPRPRKSEPLEVVAAVCVLATLQVTVKQVRVGKPKLQYNLSQQMETSFPHTRGAKKL